MFRALSEGVAHLCIASRLVSSATLENRLQFLGFVLLRRAPPPPPTPPSLLILTLSEFPAGGESVSCASARRPRAKKGGLRARERNRAAPLSPPPPVCFPKAAGLTRSRESEPVGGKKKSRRAEFSHAAARILRQRGWTASRYITHTLRVCAPA